MRLGLWSRHPSAVSMLLLAAPVVVATVVWWTVGADWVGVGAAVVAIGWFGSRRVHVEVRRRGRRRLRRSDPLRRETELLRRRFRLLRRPRLLEDRRLGSPAAVVAAGHAGPTVVVSPVLSRWLVQGDGDVVRGVLAHELGHLHRGHATVQAAQQAAGVAVGVQLSVVATVGLLPGGVWLVGAGWLLVSVLAVAQSWACELDADRAAARVGFGEPLARLFLSMGRGQLRGWVSHPPPRLRAERLARRVGELEKVRSGS